MPRMRVMPKSNCRIRACARRSPGCWPPRDFLKRRYQRRRLQAQAGARACAIPTARDAGDARFETGQPARDCGATRAAERPKIRARDGNQRGFDSARRDDRPRSAAQKSRRRSIARGVVTGAARILKSGFGSNVTNRKTADSARKGVKATSRALGPVRRAQRQARNGSAGGVRSRDQRFRPDRQAAGGQSAANARCMV